MPWFPEFAGALELARRQTHAAGQADPVGQYLAAVSRGDTKVLERAWPGDVVVFDPRAGEIRGHRQLRRFIHRNQLWLSERNARTETIADTRVGGRAVVELLVHMDGAESGWPVAVVAESPDTLSVVFRTYCSQWPVDGRRHLRPPILTSGQVHPGDVVGRFRTAVAAGDIDAAVNAFTPDGYVRESIGPHATHRGNAQLRTHFAKAFSAGGGIGMQDTAVTDDGVRCAVEYNCVRWGSEPLSPQAGLAVHERGPGDLLAAVRIYDDVEPPSGIRIVNDGRSAAEDPAERTLFETISQTYALALEPEQQAMIRQLRSHLRTVPAGERNALIADIARSVGQNLEEELEY